MSKNNNITNPFEWLKTLCDSERRTVVFYGAPGNLGDVLIAAATLQGFEKHEIPFVLSNENFDYPSDNSYVHVIMGGGNYVPLYNGVKKLLNRMNEALGNAKVVVMPSSSYGMEEHLASLTLDLFYFSREINTFNSISSVLNSNNVYLSHDTALYIDVQDRRFRAMRNLRKVVKGRQSDRLYAMREDREKNPYFEILDSHNNCDISLLRTNRGAQVLSAFTIKSDLLFEDVNFMFMYILPFKEIVTDRLHVCIAALLLGKKVVIYDNSYGKLKGVLENSLLEKYSHLITFS